MSGYSERLGELLFTVFTENATQEQLDKLATILKEFKEGARRSYQGVKQQPFGANVLQSLEEAVEYYGM